MDFNNKIATRQSYGEALFELGKINENVVVLDSDLAGFSTCGKIPFASTFAVFATGRVYDQIRNSVCYPNLNVKICATHAGITVGEDGATHQMLEDINLMRGLPNMTVISPSDDTQSRWAINEAAKIQGPVYIRFGRAATVIYQKDTKFELGKGVQFGEGTRATVFATGMMVAEALKAQEELAKEGIEIRVVDFHTIKPIDEQIIIKCAQETERLISIEEHSIIGGLGSAISEVLTDKYPAKLIRMGMKDCFGKSGNASALLKYFGLTSKEIIEEVKK